MKKILIILFILITSNVWADTHNISDAGGNFSATGAWVSGVVPQTGDDVTAQADGTSGSLNIDAATPALNSFNLSRFYDSCYFIQ